MQRSGTCIESKVAPLVGDIFLAHVDCALKRDLEGLGLKTFKYVDDYLVFCEDYDPTRKMADSLKAFKHRAFGKHRKIQFLDLSLRFEQKSCSLAL